MMRIRIIYLFVFSLILASCATTNAPIGWLPEANDIKYDHYGAWVDFSYADTLAMKEELVDGKMQSIVPIQLNRISGEFLGLNADSVYIMHESNTVKKYQMAAITDVEINVRKHNGMGYTLWTVGGCLSSVIGLYGIVTAAPLWLVVGLPTEIGDTYTDRYTEQTVAKEWWIDNSKFSRFPQGMEYIPLDSLKAKSTWFKKMMK